MNRRKVFMRKTRKGKVMKIVREHYLRDDLWCGSELCSECKGDDRRLGSVSQGNQQLQYLVLDTNCFLHQMDALEAKSGCFSNLVVLQTVLQELEHRNFKVYMRVRTQLKERDDWFVFCNEHHKHTYIERLPNESPNDRNDRAIRVAARWYETHLFAHGVLIHLITNDAENKTRAEKERLKCSTLAGYVKSRGAEFPELLDKLAQTDVDAPDKGANEFVRYLSSAEMNARLAAGTIKRGKYSCNRDYWAEAWVSQDDVPIFIPAGRRYFNRAIDGDVVAVELLPTSEWQAPSNRIAPPTEKDPEKPDAIAEVKAKTTVPTGRVVGIFERNWRPYCGSFEETEKKNGNVLFVPVNRKVPRIKVESKQIQDLMDKRIMVQMDSWPIDSSFPLGHYVKTLGKIGDMDVETEVLLIEHEIPTAPWTAGVLKCLPPVDFKITDEERAKRVDLREEFICSIDPPGCTDIDDALHCKELPNGNLQVGVHIADVSHFMRPDTALDKEAAHRGTSVYLVQRRIDMIPSLLSTDLCSLHGGVERLVFSVIWEMDRNANIVDTVFHKSVILNKGAFTYQQAQDRVDAKLTDPISVGIIHLNNLAKILKQRRIDAGALSLASTEVKFKLDQETKAPEDVALYQMKEVNSLVEEFMLLANIAVAKRILEYFPTFAMLRRHPTPKAENFLPLIRAAGNVGFDLKVETSKDLAESLDKCVIPDQPFFNKMLRILTTRCMTQAVYFSSGDLAPAEYLHYGLASPIYTHFTSPIRRYADVQVHRLLATSLGIDPLPKACEDKQRMKETCEAINHRNRMAQHVGRASSELFTLIYFRDKRVRATAMVIRVKSNGIGVLVEKYGVEGTITLWKETEEKASVNPYTYDEELLTIEGEGKRIQILDEIEVEIYVKESKFKRQWLVIDLVEGVDYSKPVNKAMEHKLKCKQSRAPMAAKKGSAKKGAKRKK